MGNQQAIQYSVPVGDKKDGETPIYRHHKFPNGLVNEFHGETTIQGMFLHTVKTHPNNKCVGKQVTTGQNSKHYVYKTYKECHDIGLQLGAGINELNLIPEVQEYKGFQLKMIGVFSKNREEWLLLECANILYGNTMIPLYETLGLEAFPYILNQTQLATLFISASNVDTILKLPSLAGLKNIVSFDPLLKPQVDQLKEKGLNYYEYSEVLEQGKGKAPQQLPAVKADDIFSFSYTSGTTGMPKGVMLRHVSFVSCAASVQYQGFTIYPNDVYLSYLPLPHVLERIIVIALMGYGACICMYGGDVQKIKDDIQLVRPTLFASVPRLFRRLYQAIKDGLDKLQGYQKKIADQAVSTKLYYLKKQGHVTHRLWDNLVFNKTKAAFGGRVRLMVSGSAPMSPEVMDFLKIAVCAHFIEGYGQTEGTGAQFCQRPEDPITGHVGGCLPHLEFKLVDVPEMKYLSTDKDEKGRPTPRGEICIRGNGVFAGYYKEEEKTAETIDKDGWAHSGDVGMINVDGSLRIIDRVKNIFKLSQGEYIAPEKVEEVYLKVRGIAECFVYGDSTKSFCVGIIVPEKYVVMEIAKAQNLEGEFEQLCQNAQIIKHFLDQMTLKGKEYKLNGMENIKKLYIEPTPMQVLGLMSNTLKLMRHQAKNHYKVQIEQMYQGAE